MKLLFLLIGCLLLSGISMNAQTIKMELTPLDIPEKVELKRIYQDGDNFWVIGHQRKKTGDIDAFVQKINAEGEVIVSNTIGKPDLFERATDIVKLPNQDSITCLLVNSTTKNLKKHVILYEIKNDTLLTERKDLGLLIEGDKVANAERMLAINDQELAIAMTYEDEGGNVFPIILRYNTKTGQEQLIQLNRNNPSKMGSGGADDVLFLGADGQKIKATADMIAEYKKFQEENSKLLTKAFGDIAFLDDKFYVVGSENTINLSDYWATQVDSKGGLIWEKLYEKEDDVGADILQAVIPLANGNTALFGEHYDKKKWLNYDFNFLLADRQGKILADSIYSIGWDEHFVSAAKTKQGFLIGGYANIEPDKSTSQRGVIAVGRKVVDSDILMFHIDEDGRQLKHHRVKRKGFQKMQSMCPFKENSFMVLAYEEYSNFKSWMIAKVLIEDE